MSVEQQILRWLRVLAREVFATPEMLEARRERENVLKAERAAILARRAEYASRRSFVIEINSTLDRYEAVDPSPAERKMLFEMGWSWDRKNLVFFTGDDDLAERTDEK
jgi:hypothetical protein